jgi:serine/threonine protein kinase
LYSLGVTCIYLLTQVSPFDLFDTSDHEWIWRQFLVNNNVRDDLGRILDKMIEFGTRKRYQSAREILQDLTGQSPATSIQTPATPRYSPTPATPVIQTPPPPKVAANIVLKSARGVNYSRLQQLLAAGKWKEADQETGKVMLHAALGEDERLASWLREGWVSTGHIANFPCEDLRTIDQLWLHYSNGKFGFSVQKEIYESLGGTREFNTKVWEKFGDCVGWRKRGHWLWESNLTFNKFFAPKAHLPTLHKINNTAYKLDFGDFPWPLKWEMGSLGGMTSLLFSRAKTCNL